MASADYIPRSEAEKIAWLKHFATWMNVHGTLKGFTAAEITELDTDVSEADTAYDDCEIKEAEFHGGVQLKQHNIADATSLSREYVKRLQADPTMTDQERADAGVTVPDTTQTPTAPGAIEEVTPPSGFLEFDKRSRVTCHFGPNPQNERENGKPAGVHGMLIQYCRGGIPEHEADWQTLDIVTRSPHIHVVHEDEPTTYTYRACWIDNSLRRGPFGDPVTCTVSV